MKISIFFATATALTVVMSVSALANGNSTYLTQNGNGNLATIDQSGGVSNVAGTVSNKLNQTRNGVNPSVGLYNRLSIVQSGDGNSVGAAGFNQTMTYGFSAQNTGYAGVNLIDIEQSSDGNVVGAVSQTSATHASGNILAITQGGAGGHTVGRVFQERTQTTVNTASITQTGSSNYLALVVQKAGLASSTPNTIVASFSGDNTNSSTWDAGSAASASGATFAALIQGREVGASYAYGNKISVDVSGDNNKIGVTQTVLGNHAVENSVEGVSITGSSNELGVFQQGTKNTLALSTIAGTGNELGVRQIGSNNTATVNVTGDFNGGANAFGGFAETVGLTEGLITQNGSNNAADLTVDGDNNVFGLSQLGDNNNVDLTQDGNTNQAAISQTGDSNTAFASQTGSSNNLAIMQ